MLEQDAQQVFLYLKALVKCFTANQNPETLLVQLLNFMLPALLEAAKEEADIEVLAVQLASVFEVFCCLKTFSHGIL